MAYPEVVTREEWLAARKWLLAAEKEHTRSRDALNAERRRLPMVRIGKEYAFEGPEGKITLPGLFGDSSQLIVQHVMFDPDWDAACPGCTASIDELADGVLTHLRSRDTAFVLVSRAPLAKLQKYQASRGWTAAWYSSHDSDFNYDFATSRTAEGLHGGDDNYAPYGDMTAAVSDVVRTNAERAGTSPEEYLKEAPGMSAFVLSDGVVHHTYSAYARGLDALWGAYQWLDRAPLGRNEEASAAWQLRDRYARTTAA
jgi:predicted dithiol-disulfide oxidoreductase (DUF899 family)